jgi:hypothetical protein
MRSWGRSRPRGHLVIFPLRNEGTSRPTSPGRPRLCLRALSDEVQMRNAWLCAAVLAIAACSHQPIKTGATPSTGKGIGGTAANANEPGYFFAGVHIEPPPPSKPVDANTPGYFFDGIRVELPPPSH